MHRIIRRGGAWGLAVVLTVVLVGCRPVAPAGIGAPLMPVVASAASTPAVTERTCDLYLPPGEIEGETIQCGYVTVPWARAGDDDATAQLAYVILKATGANAQPDAILHVAGGPGAGSTLRDAVVEFSKRYAMLRVDHDIILYDQRGMGHSIPYFACVYGGDSTLSQVAGELETRPGRSATDAELSAAACEQEWANQGFPAGNISTQTSAADLVDLMEAFDYPAYDLYGVSYGTRLLMALMHYFPDEPRVRGIVLDSPYPLPEDKVNDFAGTVEQEFAALLENLFAACREDEACAAAYPNLRERFDALVSALKDTPLRLADGSEFTDEELYRTVFPFNGAIGFVPYVPRLIAELEKGDTATLEALRSGAIAGSHHITALGVEHPRAGELIDAYLMCQPNTPDVASMDAYEERMVTLWDADPVRIVDFLNDTCTDGSGAEAAALVATLPAGVFNSIIIRFAPETGQGMNLILNGKLRCTEQFPFAPASETVIALLRERGLPEFFVQETAQKLDAMRDGCLGWRDALAAPTPSTYGDYPVLILGGAFDAITPPALAEVAAAHLPQARLVIVPNATHSILGNYGECPTALVQNFFAAPDAPVDGSCTVQMRVPWSLPGDVLPR